MKDINTKKWKIKKLNKDCIWQKCITIRKYGTVSSIAENIIFCNLYLKISVGKTKTKNNLLHQMYLPEVLMQMKNSC